jgi:hypothetical protein
MDCGSLNKTKIGALFGSRPPKFFGQHEKNQRERRTQQSGGTSRIRCKIASCCCRVMDRWVDPVEPYGRRRSLFRGQYNALGLLSCRRGAAFNRQHPFVDVLLSDNIESGEPLDTSQQVRKAPPGSFQRMAR